MAMVLIDEAGGPALDGRAPPHPLTWHQSLRAAYYNARHGHGQTQARAAAEHVGDDRQFANGGKSPLLYAPQSTATRTWVRTYISEPDRGPQSWTDQEAERDAVYANRRRIRGNRGKRLLRRRGELLERPCAHLYETGGLRRAHVRGRETVLKRLLVHAGGFNLGLCMRTLFGVGTPRSFQGRLAAVGMLRSVVWTLIGDAMTPDLVATSR